MAVAPLRHGRRAAPRAASQSPSWVSEEPALLSTGLRETRRLLVRASKRWRLVALLTLVSGGLVTLKAATRTPEFSAEVVLRIVEGADQETRMSVDQLREHIWDVAFSGPRLLDLIKRFNLNPRWADVDPAFAVDDFRESVSLTIWQNDFIAGAELRHAARVTIGFRTGVQARALPVARALGEILVNAEEGQRRARLQAQASTAQEAVQRASSQADRLRAEAAVATPDQAPPVGIVAARRASEERLRAAQTSAVSAQQRLRAIGEGQGMRFEKVDDGHEPQVRSDGLAQAIGMGAVAAVVCVPLFLLLVGAFDPFVLITEDVLQLGIPILGMVPGSGARRSGAGEPEQPSV